MGRKRASALTDAELLLMEALWSKKRATVAEVREQLPPPRPSYNSVQTRLNILADKGLARRDEHGRAIIYRPAVERERVVSSAVKQLVSRFFDTGSMLALRVIDEEKMTDSELAQLEAAIVKKTRTRS